MTPRQVRSPKSELDEFADASTSRLASAITDLARGVLSQGSTGYERAMRKLRAAIGETMALADLLGRRRVLLEMDAAGGDASFSSVLTPVPRVPFREAIEELLSREPRLAESAAEVADLYRERVSFAVARSADESVTQRVQDALAAMTKRGTTGATQTAVIEEIGEWTRGYAQTVYRTNLTTAYTAGRFRQAQEPVVARAMPAMERFSVRDAAVRRGRPEDGGENHLAAHGLVAGTRDPIWRTHAPPSGYACRCTVRLVSATELKRRGLMGANGRVERFEPRGLAAFRPHPHFGQRSPDALVYG